MTLEITESQAVTLRSTQSMKAVNGYLLVSDLDDTPLGDAEALKRLCDSPTDVSLWGA